jgi:hypothetical protein
MKGAKLDGNQKLDDTEPQSIPIEIETQEAETLAEKPNQISFPKEEPHKVDAGMVEVSLALAGLVFAVVALLFNEEVAPIHMKILLAVIGVLTNLTALWFLAVYCVQRGIIVDIQPNSNRESNEILNRLDVVWYLLCQPRAAGGYWLLAICILVLLLTFMLVLIF